MTNPFIEREDIDPIVKAELIEIERQLKFLNNIKKKHDETKDQV